MNKEKLSKEEQARYSRQIILPEIGMEGQEKIKKAKVLIIGAGGLGSPAAIYLAAAGIGTIGIIDHDKVDLTNLQRQILYNEKDVNKPKAITAKKHLEKINPNVKIIAYDEKFSSKNALEIIKSYDAVIDGSDNLAAKYLINDACVFLKKPMVYGAVFKFDGQVSVFNYNNGPCYRCLFLNNLNNDLIPNCKDAGVLGVLPGVIGTMQAAETLKIIMEKGKILSGNLLVYNALNMEFQKLNFKKNKDCAACGKSAKLKNLEGYEQSCATEKDANMNKRTIENNEITVKELKRIIDKNEDFELIDVREKNEWELCRIEGAKLIPLSNSTKNKFSDFDNLKNKKIVVYCHTGNRSGYVTSILREKGFSDVKNLIGGIDAWAREIDDKVAIY